MFSINTLILESDTTLLNELQTVFSTDDAFQLCATATNGRDGIDLIDQYHPDVVLMNLSLSGVDGVGVMQYIQSKHYTTKIFIYSYIAVEHVISTITKHGATYYFVMPIDAEQIRDRILFFCQESETKEKRRTASLDEKISNIFISIGIPPHIKGYSFLREGIKMAVENPSIMNNVTKELYPGIAKKYDTSASKVERAIRHAIEVAWNRGRIDAINAVFGVRVYIGNERPTNSEFIALVADKLLLEELL